MVTNISLKTTHRGMTQGMTQGKVQFGIASYPFPQLLHDTTNAQLRQPQFLTFRVLLVPFPMLPLLTFGSVGDQGVDLLVLVESLTSMTYDSPSCREASIAFLLLSIAPFNTRCNGDLAGMVKGRGTNSFLSIQYSLASV